ncbi:MAG: hypothetical protein JWM75_655 [Sphingomonas bacterium]|nr:hypothetical protein [Sphingomonas bacterium]
MGAPALALAPREGWSWQPSKTAWFDRMHDRATAFVLAPELAVDLTGLRRTLCDAAEARAEWLYHPALSWLCRPAVDDSRSLDPQILLAAWVARHGASELGAIQVPSTSRLWTPGGPIELAPGCYALDALGAAMRARPIEATIDLDLFGDTLGASAGHACIPDGAWRPGEDNPDAEAWICAYLSALAFLAEELPAISAWLTCVAKVAVPLRQAQDGPEFRSASDPELPGLICMDFGCGAVRMLEALIHESAHQYFYLAEAAAPIVPPDRESLRFPSPLKAKARPLRGVMLAYHALAYITALYDALERAGVTSDRRGLADELAQLRAAADAAEATCLKARHLLTAHGRHFLDQTYEGVRHGTGG